MSFEKLKQMKRWGTAGDGKDMYGQTRKAKVMQRKKEELACDHTVAFGLSASLSTTDTPAMGQAHEARGQPAWAALLETLAGL